MLVALYNYTHIARLCKYFNSLEAHSDMHIYEAEVILVVAWK